MPTKEPRPVKSRRNALSSARVSDQKNTEGLSNGHQQALATKPVLDLIKRMRRLSGLLPDSVPEASEDDNEIHRVMTEVHGLTRYSEKTAAKMDGSRRGELGMVVVKYLEGIHWTSAGIPHDLSQLKLERSYKKIYNNGMHTKRTIHPQQHPAPASSFLDSIYAFNDDDDTAKAPASELDLFFAAFRTQGRDSRNTPLLW
ncbi:hypothetical protein DFH08DRAFT_816221 [Mycena albidolilacea]|uniref:Uncharacterized protein n=1 Tax=Mycena albidolilacea TaxID=1033008 RepID=A0AAD7EK03_9AGAR|nr:hypothetical protein DFH08DRAFT_816221 [Mycena albidolilacea]